MGQLSCSSRAPGVDQGPDSPWPLDLQPSGDALDAGKLDLRPGPDHAPGPDGPTSEPDQGKVSLDAPAADVPSPDSAPDPCDQDGDGFPALSCKNGLDCDDGDPAVHPGAKETDDWVFSLLEVGTKNVTVAEWQNETYLYDDVDLALAPDGTSRIVFITNSTSGGSVVLKSESAAGVWTSTNVEGPDAKGRFNTKVTVDPDGAVHLSYVVTSTYLPTNSGTLRHASNASGSWSFDDVQTPFDAFAPHDLVVDASGTMHLVYLIGADLLHASKPKSGPLVTEPIGKASMYAWPALTLTPAGGPRLVYLNTNGQLAVAELSGSGWVESLVTVTSDAGRQLAAALDAQGKLRVAHRGAATSPPIYLSAETGSWAQQTVSAGSLGASPGVAPRGAGAYVTYVGTHNNLHYLFYASDWTGSWKSYPLADVGGCTGPRCRIPLALAADGTVRGAIIKHWWLSQPLRFKDEVYFFKRAAADGVDYGCNGE